MESAQQRFDFWIRILLGAMLIALAFLCVLLVQQYRALRAQEFMGAHLPGLHGEAPIPLTDASAIQSWMTYDYISHVYALPPDYLKTTLNINDTHYPRVTIAESAEAQGVTAGILTAEVRTAVSDYIASKSPTTGS